MIKGVPVSGGIELAPLLVFCEDELKVRQIAIPASRVEAEVARFSRALKTAGQELQKIKTAVSQDGGGEFADIFGAHLLILDDPLFVVETVSRIRKARVNAEWAIHEALEEVAVTFSKLEDEYIRERMADLRDVGCRVLHVLMEQKRTTLSALSHKVILAAQRLYPSDLAMIDMKHVVGIITEEGSNTSHTAIVARALNLPAVVGAKGMLTKVATGEFAILDAFAGRLLLNPSDDKLKEFRFLRRRHMRQEKDRIGRAHNIARTKDGTQIDVLGNLEMVEEIAGLLHLGGDGVGLFRSEFIFFNRLDLPTEDQQYECYAKLLKKMKKRPVIIRTADIGGDKFLADADRAREVNPGMGLRAIRLGFANKKMLQDQLAALLRAAVHGNLSIMFPMVSSVEEIQRLKRVVEGCRDKLRERKVKFADAIRLGIMIEIPSAAVALDTMIREIDFISIGTNDLVQYVLAVERGNPEVSDFYQPFHPAILRLLANVARIADSNGVEVSVCGELAWNPVFVVYFLGLGISKLSMGANAIPEIKKLIRSLTLADCQRHAENMLTKASTRAVERYARKEILPTINKILPELAERNLLHLTSV